MLNETIALVNFTVACPYCGNVQNTRVSIRAGDNNPSGTEMLFCDNDGCNRKFVIEWCVKLQYVSYRINQEELESAAAPSEAARVAGHEFAEKETV